MGRAWARNLSSNPGSEIAGWVDLRPAAAESAAKELELTVPYFGVDLDQAIRDVQPDFVVDVTIPEAHCSVTVAALGAGIPVIGEKPMASSLEEAKRMIRASDESGKLYMVSQSRRYHKFGHAYRDLIRAEIGRLGILNADFYIGAHFGGFRDEMRHVLLLDMAIHTLDAARFFSDADPISVYAEEFNPEWSWYAHDAGAMASFEMTGGLKFVYRGCWCAEGANTSWEAEWRAIGRTGTAIWDGSNPAFADVVTETGGFTSKTKRVDAPVRSVPDGIAGSLAEFLDALAGGPTPNGECHDNIKSLAMVFGAIESAKRGERVTIAELMA